MSRAKQEAAPGEVLADFADDAAGLVHAVVRGELPELVAAVSAGNGPAVSGRAAPSSGWAAAAAVYEALLGSRRRRARKVSGAYYTSRRLVDRLVGLTLDPLLGAALRGDTPAGGTRSAALRRLRILDPCVGGGAFLVAAARRLGVAFAAAGLRPEAAASCLCGVDSDPLAVEIAAGALAEVFDRAPGDLAGQFRVADTLGQDDLGQAFKGVGPDGFDAVIGNPPWEIVKPNSREFFAQYDPDFRRLPKQRALTRVAELCADPEIARAWTAEQARVEALAARCRRSGAFRHQGPSGDLNTYKLFLERAIELTRPGGRVGLIVPSGFHTDLGARDLRRLAFEENTVECLLGFENRRGLFPIDRRYKFDLVVLTRGGRTRTVRAVFMAHDPAARPAVTVRLADLRRFSPRSLSLPEFRSATDARVTAIAYDGKPLLGEPPEGGWALDFRREFDLTIDSHLFNGDGRGLPLWEGKMVNQYDPAFAAPRYWVEEEAGRRALAGRLPDACDRPRLAVRSIAASTNQRTLIAAVVPPGRFLGNSLLYASHRPPARRGRAPGEDELHFACALLNSFVLDFLLRQKVSTNVNKFYLEQLPFPRPSAGDPAFDRLAVLARRLTNAASRAAAQGALRAEVEARVAALYGLDRAAFEHVLMAPYAFPGVDRGFKLRCLAAFDRLRTASPPEGTAAEGTSRPLETSEELAGVDDVAGTDDDERRPWT